ncbi:hypothetical protein ACFL55_00445 [Candidatus Latescibacterota bacterium]
MRIFVIIALSILTALTTITMVLPHAETLTIVYTGNAAGKLESCGCPNDPYGGYIERATLMRDLRERESPFLLVDGGQMVSLFGDYAGKAELVMELMNLMGYDAAGIEASELFYGVAGAAPIRRTASFPLLSSSVLDSTGAPAFEPVFIKSIGDVRVAIIGVTDSTGIDRLVSTRVSDFTLIPPEQAVAGALDVLSEEYGFIIILSSLAPSENEKLLEQFAEIDLIVEVTGNRRYEKPKVLLGGIIVSPGNGGQFVGLITLDRSAEGVLTVLRHEFLPVLDIPVDDAAAKLLDAYNATLQ